MSEQTFVRLTFEPVSEDDLNGECKITLLRSVKGKEDQIKTWTCPDVEDGVWMWSRVAKNMKDQVLALAKQFRGEEGIPGATATVIPLNIKDVVGVLQSLGLGGFGTGNPFDPFAPLIKVGATQSKEDFPIEVDKDFVSIDEEDKENPQPDEVPDLPE